MKLAFVTQFPLDINYPSGGVEAVSVNLVRSLAEFRQLDIHVVTLCRQTNETSCETWNKVTIHRLPKPGGSELLNAVTKSKKLISNHLVQLKPDLINALDTYGIMVQDVPITKVFTLHGFIYENTRLSSGRLSWLRAGIWKFIEQASWAKQANIISISPYVRERVSSVSRAMIYDIDNPISDAFFKVERNENKGIIFSSGAISPLKNTLILVKAVALVLKAGYKIELRIAGHASDSRYAQEIDNWICENNLADNIKLLGKISVNKIMAELSQASIYALVSLNENSPMGIEEAMAAGVPVITSNRCGMPYMVRNDETGYLVDPLDEHSIAKKIALLLDDDSLRLAMGNRAKERAQDLYHSDKVAKRTHAVYRELLER